MSLEQIADRLVERVRGALVRTLAARREEILAGVLWVARPLVRAHWPAIESEVMRLAGSGLAELLRQYGGLTVNDLLALVLSSRVPPGEGPRRHRRARPVKVRA